MNPLVFSINNQALLMNRIAYYAISGPHGNGALPAGEYDLGELVDLDPETAGNGFAADGVAFWIKLTPRFKTYRVGMGIHPDGNVPGTLGCIGLQPGEPRRFKRAWAKLPEPPTRLIVVE